MKWMRISRTPSRPFLRRSSNMPYYGYDSHEHADISALVGETCTAVFQRDNDGDELVFETESGKTFCMYHQQDCCEHVYIEDVVGNLEELVGSPILKASEDSNSAENEHLESETWTFYNLATQKGYVTIRWYGSSDGYYSEGVDFILLK